MRVMRVMTPRVISFRGRIGHCRQRAATFLERDCGWLAFLPSGGYTLDATGVSLHDPSAEDTLRWRESQCIIPACGVVPERRHSPLLYTNRSIVCRACSFVRLIAQRIRRQATVGQSRDEYSSVFAIALPCPLVQDRSMPKPCQTRSSLMERTRIHIRRRDGSSDILVLCRLFQYGNLK